MQENYIMQVRSPKGVLCERKAFVAAQLETAPVLECVYVCLSLYLLRDYWTVLNQMLRIT